LQGSLDPSDLKKELQDHQDQIFQNAGNDDA